MATPTTWLSEFQANTGTANTPTTSDPQTIGLSNGNILVAWTESGITGVGTAAGFDIIGKIYDGAGNLVRDSYRINTVRNVDEESDFDIAPTNDGGFILVYVDNDGVDSAVLWERKNAAGNNLNSREIISETGAGDYDNPQVAVNNIDNSSFVTYTSFNPSAFLDPADEDVLAVRLSAVGAIITAEFEAARDAPIFSADDQTQNDVAININGEMISAYIDEGTVKVDVYATTGLYLHTATVDTNGSPSDPQVATLSGGNIVVTWTDDVAGFSSGDVNHAVFNSDLGVVLAKTTIDSVDANETAIVALPNDEYIVVWDDDNIATNDIKAQKFDSDGSADGAIFTVDVSLGTSPDIGVTGDGRVIFAWSAASNVYTSIWDPRDGTIFAGDYADSEENFVDAAIIWAKIAGGPLNGSGNTDDHLIGMSGNDSILGYLGNDTLEGNAGDDWLFGNRGDDSLLGGAGDDTFEYFSDISFESFSDMTAGTDTIEGGAGTDQITIIEGGTTLLNAVGTQWSGLERINFFAADFFGGDKTLRVRGDELTDGFTSGIAIVGRPDANLREIIEVFMHSDASIDLSGTTFTNWTDGFDYVEIKGDESDETITGTSASDYVSGWDGDDDIILTATTTGLEETIHGGDGYDEIVINSSGVIDLSNSGTEISGIEEIRFNASGASMVRLATDETDSATELLNVIINGYSGLATDRNLIEVVVNTIDTDLSGWTFLQWDNASGDDEFIRIIGNANAQNVVGSIVRDQFELGAGNDTIDGRAGNDTIIATAGQNEMDGGADDDLFMLAAGALLNQTIVGGAGDDMLDLSLVAGSSSTFVTAFEIDGGYSANGAAFSGDWSELENLTGTSGYRNNITGNDSANILTGGNLGDTIDGGLGDDTLFGLSGNDTINGGSGKDDVSGGVGDDVFLVTGGDFGDDIDGGGDTDTLDLSGWTNSGIAFNVNLALETYEFSPNAFAANGIYTIENVENVIGSDFNDSIIGSGGVNDLAGGSGNDTMFGFGGDDTMSGNGGNDEVRGNGGNDIVGGEGGNDAVFGGEGNDSLYGGAGNDTLSGGAGNDLLNGGGNFDVADYTDAVDNLVVNINFAGAQTVSALMGTDTFVSIEGILGGTGNDLLVGSSAGDVIDGGAGNDEIYGIGNSDILRGGTGNDQIEGSGGNDTMEGGAGDADVLSYYNSAGAVAVDLRLQGTAQAVGGSSGTDTFTEFEDLFGSNIGNDILIGNNDDTRILGFGGDDRLFGFDGDDDLIGMQGNDSLNGGLGADTVSGGGGADAFLFNDVSHSTSVDRDTITDFGVGGADKVDLSVIDASNIAAGNQAFNFVGTAAFGSAGDLRFATNGTNGFVLGDVDGDGTVDLNILLLGVTSMTAGDFIL